MGVGVGVSVGGGRVKRWVSAPRVPAVVAAPIISTSGALITFPGNTRLTHDTGTITLAGTNAAVGSYLAGDTSTSLTYSLAPVAYQGQAGITVSVQASTFKNSIGVGNATITNRPVDNRSTINPFVSAAVADAGNSVAVTFATPVDAVESGSLLVEVDTGSGFEPWFDESDLDTATGSVGGTVWTLAFIGDAIPGDAEAVRLSCGDGFFEYDTPSTGDVPGVENEDVTNVPPTPPLTGLGLWLRASDILAHSNGDPVAAADWPDASGNVAGPSSVSGTPPTYVANAGNGQPGVQFNADGYYQTGCTTDPKTIVAVYKLTTLDATNQHIAGAAGSGGEGAYFFVPDNGSRRVVYYRGESVLATSVLPVPQVSDGLQITIGTQNGTGTPIKLYRDRQLSATSGNLGAVPTIAGGLVLGAYWYGGGAAAALKGIVCELLVYDHVLTVDEMATLYTYLGSRYVAATIPQSGKYYLGTFCGDVENPDGQVLVGSDGTTFSSKATLASAPLVCARDTAPFIYGGKLYGAYTNGYPAGAFGYCTEFGIFGVLDGRLPQTVSRIDMSDLIGGGDARCWLSGVTLNDDNTLYVDGSGYCWFTVTTSVTGWPTTGSTVYFVPVLASDLSTRGTPVAVSGVGFFTKQIAGNCMRLANGTYLLAMKKEQTILTSDAELKIFASSSLTSGYTLLYDAGPLGGNWGSIEGGYFLRLPGGNLRIYYDRFDIGAGQAFRDSTDNGVTWGGETGVTGDGTFTPRNGGVILAP